MNFVCRAFALALLLALGACATSPAGLSAARVAKQPLPPSGLQRIIGSAAEGVTALLGPASLDRSEGPARLLQFIRPPCVLDVFLYPGKAGVPVVTTAAARKADGSRIEAGACLTLIAPPPPTAPPQR
jgi:hypothetical protein